MNKRHATVAALAVAAAVAGGAVAGGRGLVFDDGHYVRPGTLDDGSELLPQAAISTGEAVDHARAAAAGALGQVDLARVDGRLVYVVDVGSSEVRVDAADGTVAGIAPQS